MKKNSNLQKIGVLLGIIGAVMIISNAFVTDLFLKKILAFDQFVFWLGLLLWLFGYRKSLAAAKKGKQPNSNELNKEK